MSPPLNIYFLGELKHLEAREKIVDDSGLMACLDKIVGWNICDNPILPEILFQFGQSPINTPDKLTKKSSAISSPSHLLSSRSGQTEFNEGVLRRDLNSCMFCDATGNLSAAHLIAYKEIGSPSLNAIFAKCHIGTIQDLANGITLCKMCHDQFDYHFVGVNPETMRVEVSRALLDSKSSEIRDKWNLIHGKTIEKLDPQLAALFKAEIEPFPNMPEQEYRLEILRSTTSFSKRGMLDEQSRTSFFSTAIFAERVQRQKVE
jgi:hypothetical protein